MGVYNYDISTFKGISFTKGIYIGEPPNTTLIFNSSGAFVGSMMPSSISTTGTLSVAGISSLGQIKAQSGLASYSALFGADSGANTLTNLTTKMGILAIPHYTNAELPMTAILCQSTSTNNDIYIGGGTSGNNAATRIFFYTGANTTTTTGTLAASIDASQACTIGPSSGGTAAFCTIQNGCTAGSNIGLLLKDTSGAGYFSVGRDVNTGYLSISGSATGAAGARIQLYGHSHATTPSTVVITCGSNHLLSADQNAAFTLGGAGQAHTINGASVTISGATLLDVQKSSAGAAVLVRAYNFDNTNTASHGSVRAEVGGTSGGDAYHEARITSGNAWAWGLDNSASDNWSLSYGSAGSATLGTNEFLRVTTAGVATFSGQLIGKGTATNDSAAAGYIGEYVESVVSTYTNLPGATTVWGNMTSISLTAGDWDVTGIINWIANGATVTAGIDLDAIAISINSGTTTSDHVQGSNQVNVIAPSASTDRPGCIPNYRLSLSGTTTVYFKILATYSVANPQFKCRLSARRVR